MCLFLVLILKKGIYLNEQFNFNYHIKEKMAKPVKGIGVIKTLSKILPWYCLITIYKLFVGFLAM